ncbi:MAG: tRNA (adenosine(37)-N6)-dimethylallyltransferase MiaA [Bacilli bacterium]|nr:tRNA (adenosine(37)-N6)-dimethylallyltransferase MiaA [Bacilli bacterium]
MFLVILAIVGPTGVGKTKLSIELAKYYNAIIINCDAMQVYQEMNIGTAKITEEEKENIPHHLFDICNLDDNYSVFNYQQDARKLLEENKDKNIILVGGTGLYLKALLYDYEFAKQNDENYEKYSNEELYKLAIKKDHEVDIHQNNRQRLISFLKRENSPKTTKKLYDAQIIGLTTSREKLYDIINKRVDKMIENGLLEEARNLYQKYPDSRALNTAIGYKELFKYFNNEITLDEAIYQIKINSRHYAKRQYTWFNHQLNVKWVEVDFNNFNNTIECVKQYIDNGA